jgi:hypothetical protein
MKLLNNSMKHIHHILPKYLGGTDDPSNLVELTVEEHAEAHRLLYEQYGNWQDYCAWQALSGRLGKEEVLRMAQGMANKGKKRSPETIAKMKEAALKREARHRADGTLEKKKQNIANAMKGYKKSKEHLDNWAKSRKGHVVSEETRAKTRATLAETRAKKKLAEASLV